MSSHPGYSKQHTTVDSPKKKGQAQLKCILKEPFFHFILLGILLFSFNEYLEERANHREIVVTAAQIQGIADNYRLQYGNLPSKEQLQALVDSFIKEEVFYHEALRLNLDKEDEIIRRRLVQKFEFLQQDLAVNKEPSEAELLAFYENHQHDYLIPNKVSFTHIYFSTDVRGQEGAKQAASQTLVRLQQTALPRAPEWGDTFPGLYDFTGLAQADVKRLFGDSELASQVFSVPVNSWLGPFRSGYGWHLPPASD
jgi:hypothetical protein